jgi:diguanylate cyclase (GGDEF)-like protein/PAS domain S-box-containing protein
MPILNKPMRPALVGMVVFLISSLLAAVIVYLSEQHRRQLEQSRALAMASDHAQALQQNLQQALSATLTLATLVQQGHGDIANFEALARDMLLRYPGVSAMALEPGGVVQRIVPLDGDAHALGLDLLRHAAREKEAKLARDSGQLTLAGPYELVQGGLGALGFYPVFVDDSHGQRSFWGFVNVVLRLPQALAPTQLEQIVARGYDYALWHIDPASQQRQIIAQSAKLPLGSADFDLKVPNAKWTLSVAPTSGWADPQGLSLSIALAALFSVLLAYGAKQTQATRLRAKGLQVDVNTQASELVALNQRLQSTLDALPDLLFETDLDGRYLDCHSPRSDLLPAPSAELLGKTLHQVLPVEAADICLAAVHEANASGYSHGKQIKQVLPDGLHWFELSASRKHGSPGDVPTFIVLSRDITGRKKVEIKVERLTKLYAALSQCNQAIVRCSDANELFPIICRDAVNFGGMKMAWIGMLDETDQLIKPVASFGSGVEYLDRLEISVDPASNKGRGPTGTSIREGRPFWCQDFQHDVATTAWHERGASFGWGASASLPLHLKSRVVGAFTLYSGEVGAFDEAAQNLLLEMALDISFALERFADERAGKQMQDDLRDSEERYRKAFQTSPDAVNITRLADGRYVDVNEGFERITGWQHDEVVGKTATELHLWGDTADRQRMVDALQRDGRCSNLEANFVKKNGDIFPGLMSAEKIRLKDVDCILSITRDITELKRAQAQIQQLAHFDQLTGLPNRSQLQDRFKYALSLAQRHGGQLAVMFLDLDHFKNINDTLGHSIGDQLLVDVSRRLKAALREEDSLSRLGGDEFILLLPGTHEAGASQVAAKLLAAVAQPCQIEQYELMSTVSIGIAIYPNDGQDFETLSKNADAAMYRVKHASRNSFRFFTQEMQLHSARTLQLVNALRHALSRHEFELHFQPQVALQDGHIVGAEALLRWHHPELGIVSPVEFIPIAEDSGQILEIGEWVLRTAVMQLKQWLDAGLPPMVMAVNLSAVQFRHPNLIDLVTRILDEAALPPEHLELELTEAAAMDDPPAAIAVMNRLDEHGIRMSIDDFGTGYSSLSYLKKFKVYKLKIDQSFVRDISDDPDDKAIVTAIINLASSLGMHTIAEGVETASQLAFLRLQGCDEVQGYYFSKPLPKDQFEAFVRNSIS